MESNLKLKMLKNTQVLKISQFLKMNLLKNRKRYNLNSLIRYGGDLAKIVKDLIQSKNYDKVIAPATAFGKDLIPRLGGLLDV